MKKGEKLRRWTSEEDEVLFKIMNDHMNNRNEGIRIASKKLNRSFSACNQRWYCILSNPNDKRYKGVSFVMANSKESIINRTQRSVYIKPKSHAFDLWKAFIKKLFNLD